MADNDLALGRIVSFLSRTSIWKDSALFVTEDDAQGGIDHIDAHRSVLLVASPWVKPGSVSRQHTSMGSITRTIDELLGLGPLNLEDALAGEIGGIFDTQLHLDLYKTRPPIRAYLFLPALALRARRPRAKPLLCVTSTIQMRSAKTWNTPRATSANHTRNRTWQLFVPHDLQLNLRFRLHLPLRFFAL